MLTVRAELARSALDAAPDAMIIIAAHTTPDLLVADCHLGRRETGTRVIAAVRRAAGEDRRAMRLTGDTSTAIRELPRDPHLRLASKPLNAQELRACCGSCPLLNDSHSHRRLGATIAAFPYGPRSVKVLSFPSHTVCPPEAVSALTSSPPSREGISRVRKLTL